MQATMTTTTVSTSNTVNTNKVMLWVGRVISALGVAFLVMDAIIKIINIQPVIDASLQLGLPVNLAPTFGLLLLACTTVYVMPRTSVLGAILLTGYLGGAIAIQVRVIAEPFSLVFPLILAALLWGGLILRNREVRALLLPQR
jgi:hypothetical protein